MLLENRKLTKTATQKWPTATTITNSSQTTRVSSRSTSQLNGVGVLLDPGVLEDLFRGVPLRWIHDKEVADEILGAFTHVSPVPVSAIVSEVRQRMSGHHNNMTLPIHNYGAWHSN